MTMTRVRLSLAALAVLIAVFGVSAQESSAASTAGSAGRDSAVAVEYLAGEAVRVVTNGPAIPAVLRRLQELAPDVRWIPVEAVHASYGFVPNRRLEYGKFLILETTGAQTVLADRSPLSRVGSSPEPRTVVDRSLRRSGEHFVGQYFIARSVDAMLDRLPEIVRIADQSLGRERIADPPIPIRIPPDGTPLLRVHGGQVVTVDIASGAETVVFAYDLEFHDDRAREQFDWTFAARSVPPEIAAVHITLFVPDTHRFGGSYQSAQGFVVDGALVLARQGVSARTQMSPPVVEGLQVLLADGTLLSYPYDLLPRIRAFDPQYYDQIGPWIWWVAR